MTYTAIELFCGIGGFRLACDDLQIKTIWANDIDPKAAIVYQSQFGSEGFYLGDLRIFFDEIPSHDILTAGFPCQPFSSAGKKMGIHDPRGTLFSEIVKVIDQHRPQFFVLENVKRLLSMQNGSHFATILDAFASLKYFIEWRVVNAAWFGLPQNRERVLIVGCRDLDNVSYLYANPDLDDHSQSQFVPLNTDQLQAIETHGKRFASWGVAKDGMFFDQDLHYSCIGHTHQMKVRDILEDHPDEQFFFTEDTLARIQDSEKVNRYFNGVEILYNQKGGARMGYSIFGINGLAPTLTSTTSRHYERYQVGSEYRRLTNIEYARLQGFPDRHCREIAPYHQYALLGNAVPPAMVKWVLRRMIDGVYSPMIEGTYPWQQQSEQQLELFQLV